MVSFNTFANGITDVDELWRYARHLEAETERLRADKDVIRSQERNAAYEADIKQLQDQLCETQRLSFFWMKKHDKLLGFIQARPAMLKKLIEDERPVDKRSAEP